MDIKTRGVGGHFAAAENGQVIMGLGMGWDMIPLFTRSDAKNNKSKNPQSLTNSRLAGFSMWWD